MELKAKLSTLARRVEELEGKILHEVQAVTEVPLEAKLSFICQSIEHVGEQCPTIPAVREMFSDQVNFVGQSKPPPNVPYNNTYRPNWRNHPNLSWKPDPPTHVPLSARQQSGSPSQPQPPLTSSPVEQAIVNLMKVVGEFVEVQKGINVQLAHIIDTVESNLNKKIDGLQSDLNQKIDNLQYSITMITNLLEVHEKGRFPAQAQPNPRGVLEIGSASSHAPRMDEVKLIITLRSGKQVDQPVPKPTEETREEKEAEHERIIIKEDSMKKSMPPPFPQALKGKKKASK